MSYVYLHFFISSSGFQDRIFVRIEPVPGNCLSSFNAIHDLQTWMMWVGFKGWYLYILVADARALSLCIRAQPLIKTFNN